MKSLSINTMNFITLNLKNITIEYITKSGNAMIYHSDSETTGLLFNKNLNYILRGNNLEAVVSEIVTEQHKQAIVCFKTLAF